MVANLKTGKIPFCNKATIPGIYSSEKKPIVTDQSCDRSL